MYQTIMDDVSFVPGSSFYLPFHVLPYGGKATNCTEDHFDIVISDSAALPYDCPQWIQ